MNPWHKLRELAEEFDRGYLRAQGLRFSLGFLRGSEVAQQFFCEMKLHIQYERGEVDYEQRRLAARNLVRKVLGAKRLVTRGWSSLPLVAVLHDVPVVSSLDAALVDGDRVELVVKAREAKPSRKLYATDEALARLHLLMLEELGFKVSTAKYVFIRGSREALASALMQLQQGKIPLPGEELSVHVLSHDPARSEEMIGWALAYWLMKRPPQAMPSRNKCANCPYRSLCPATSDHLQ